MKNIFFLLSFCLFLTSNLKAANRFVEKTFYSTALNQDKTYFVSFPDGYSESDTTKKFPVIVFLHGAGVNAKSIVEEFDPIFSNPLAKLLYPNFFKVIFIIPDGSVAPYLGSFYTNSALYGNFETYISTDLTNEIRKNYNTYKHREKWSVMGHSMGGYGSMKIALKYPDQFIGIAALSGPLHVTYYNDILPLILAEQGNTFPYKFENFDSLGNVTKLVYSMAGAFSPNLTINDSVDFPVLSDGSINKEITSRWEANNPINLIRKWNGKPKMAIFMYCGELDEYKLLSQNQLFSDTLLANNITHTFKIDPYGDHVKSLLTSFPLGLNFLYNVMDTSKIVVKPNAISEIVKRKDFIFPNPVKNQLNFSSPEISEIKSIAIISITGSFVKKYSIDNLKNGLDISEIKSGCYLLTVSYLNGQKGYFNFIKTD